MIENQMAFEEVTQMETIPGDDAYTLWVKAGRPVLDDPADALSVLKASPHRRRRKVETLPGL